MTIWRGLVLLAILQSIGVLAHNNYHSTTDRHLKKTVSNSILLKLRKRENVCPPDEYHTGTRCCKLCNAGTYAQTDCSVEHGNPQCKDCSEGVTYMDFKNGYGQCHKCLKCDTGQGQKELQACTVLKNTVCKCAENFFCAENRTEESEHCLHCKHCTTCENGHAEKCTATKDAVCTKERQHLYPLIALLVVPIFCLICYCYCARKRANTYERTQSDPQSVTLPDDLRDIDLANYLSAFSEIMELNTVLSVVRKMGLADPTIDAIQHDYVNQSNEQKYHLLKNWYESHGRTGAFQELITRLRHKQRIVEQLIQIIRSHEQNPQGQ